MCNSCSAPQTHKLSSNIQSTATDNKHSVTLLNLQSALSIGSKNVAELMEAPFYQYKIQRFFSLAHFKAALTPLYYVAPVVHKQIYHRARNSTRKLLAVIRHSTWRLLFRMSWLLQPGSAVGVVGCVARLDMTRYFCPQSTQPHSLGLQMCMLLTDFDGFCTSMQRVSGMHIWQ